MKDKWRFIDLGKIDGFRSAAVFEAVSKKIGCGHSPETIIFWRVSSPVVYVGYHQCLKDEINTEYCRDYNIGIVRRILGGGCGFCDERQIIFSCIGRENGIIPADIQAAYAKVLGGVVNALNELGAGGVIEPVRNAVHTKGKKISGNAQGRFYGSTLVNGSLLLDFDFDLMEKVLKNPTKNLYPVKNARDGMITLKEMGIIEIEHVKKALRDGFEKALCIETVDGTLTEEEIGTAEILLEKYKSDDWTYMMDIKHALRKTSSSLLPQRS